MDRKLQRHRADSLRQHGFLVSKVSVSSRTGGTNVSVSVSSRSRHHASRLQPCLMNCLKLSEPRAGSLSVRQLTSSTPGAVSTLNLTQQLDFKKSKVTKYNKEA